MIKVEQIEEAVVADDGLLTSPNLFKKQSEPIRINLPLRCILFLLSFGDLGNDDEILSIVGLARHVLNRHIQVPLLDMLVKDVRE